MGVLPLGSSSPRLGNIGDDMMREEAHLGVPLGDSGLGTRAGLSGLGSPWYGSHPGIGDRNALLDHAGVSPRLAAFDDFGSDPYGCLGTAAGLGRRSSIGSLDGYGDLGGSRSRRGSLTGRTGLGGPGEYDAFGTTSHGRRDSLPFEETPLFDTRGY